MSLAPEPNPYASPRALSPWQANWMAVAWSLISALAGGLLCGLCVSRFGEFGALALAACGAFGGYVSRKITHGPSKAAGICAVVAACLMFFTAETCWIRWNTVQGETGWWTALTFWPAFVREYELSALIGAVFAAYGAWCAYGYATSPSGPPIAPVSPAPPP